MTELAAASALATAALTQEELFPIREVSRLTGVNPVHPARLGATLRG